MTEIDFHVNVPDTLAHTCRLLRKAVAGGARVVVTGETAVLAALDTQLWTFGALDFVPHCRSGASPQILARTPVVLAAVPAQAPHQQVLVNLGAEVPVDFERFERLIEVVASDDVQRQQARLRWKHYTGRGYAVDHHDLAQKEGA